VHVELLLRDVEQVVLCSIAQSVYGLQEKRLFF
jgi:hypothetical protein